jgi:Asparaginase, N-terminal
LNPILLKEFPDLTISYIKPVQGGPGWFPESSSGTLDSTNLQPTDWCIIAQYILSNYAAYDGWVILHGTNSMDFTGTALPLLLSSFAANGVPTAVLSKPVIITGSQVPLFYQSTPTHPAIADITTTVHGFDMTAITSNAKTIYAKDEDVTSILINGNTVAMENGKNVTKRRIYLIALSVPVKAIGTFKIKSNKKISATITLPEFQPGYACACQEDLDGDNRAHCLGGSITITKYGGKYEEGTLVAHLESSDCTNPPTLFFATLHGKFKVLVANAK